MDKDTETISFGWGIVVGGLLCMALVMTSSIITQHAEHSGYENKLVIRYHSPNKDYDRHMMMDLMEKSGISTNFVDSKVEMSSHSMEWTLTNPSVER